METVTGRKDRIPTAPPLLFVWVLVHPVVGIPLRCIGTVERVQLHGDKDKPCEIQTR